jgi:hypothetical protein
LLSVAAAVIFAAAVAMGATGREPTAVAFMAASLVALLAGVFAGRVVKAGKDGITLVPLQELLAAANELERERPDDKGIVDVFRQVIRELSSGDDPESTVDRAVKRAAESAETESKLADEAVRRLTEDGWIVDRQPQLGDAPRPDFLARRSGEILVGEVKSDRGSLDPDLLDRFSEIETAVRGSVDDAPAPEIRPMLVLGAARGRPTIVERDLEHDAGAQIMKINPSTLH